MRPDAYVAVDQHAAIVGGPASAPVVAQAQAVVRHMAGSLTEGSVMGMSYAQRTTFCRALQIRIMLHSQWRADRQNDLEIACSS